MVADSASIPARVPIASGKSRIGPTAVRKTDATIDGSVWESTLRRLLDAPSQQLWRRHSDALNAKLFARWLSGAPCERLLKTDLFDEAMGSGLYPLLASRAATVAGIDIAPSVRSAASARHPGLLAVGADVRALPFADASFDAVVSNSTLDHFATREEILLALAELHRVLRPGGRLLLTLDNPANPLIALRNAAPFRLLRRLRLLDYPVGATLGPRRLDALLRGLGFEVLEAATLLHCPRALAVARARRLDRAGSPEARARFLDRLARWERCASLPTRHLTAHYIGVAARRL
jgi:SAM-dependent methyltransferase